MNTIVRCASRLAVAVGLSGAAVGPLLAQATLNNTAPDLAFRTGVELFDKQKYGAAQQAFQEYLRLETRNGQSASQPSAHPGNLRLPEAEYYAGVCALYLFNPDAEAQLARFAATYPNHPRASVANYELGNFFFAKKDYPKAAEYLGQVDLDALDKNQRTEARFKLGYAHFTKQEFDKAGGYFNAVKLTPGKYAAPAGYYAGFIEYRQGKYAEALTDLKRAEKEEAYAREVPYMIANVYYKQQRYPEMLAYTEKTLADNGVTLSDAPRPAPPAPSDPLKKGGKGSSEAPAKKVPLKKGGRGLSKPQPAADPTSEEPAATGLKNADELVLLTAEAYYRQGKYDRAAPYFRQYASMTRAKPAADVQYRIAYADYISKDYANAAEGFKTVASARDTLGQYAAYYLGMSYLQQKNLNFALPALDQARRGKFSKPVQEEAGFTYAKVQLDAGNNADAIAALQEFTRAFPNSRYQGEAEELLGEAYLGSNNYPEAIAQIEKIRVPTPRTNAAYQRVTYNQGVTSYNGDRFAEAITYFDKSLSKPLDADLALAANFWKGESQSALRKYDDAIASYAVVFRKAEEGTRGKTDDYALKSRYGIAYCYYNQKAYDKAAVHFREYVGKLGPGKLNYADALIRLADCQYAMKSYDEALRSYDLAVTQNNPDKDYAQYQKGIILSLLGREGEARIALDKAGASGNARYAESALYQKAELSFKKGDYPNAVTQYSDLITRRPQSPLVPFALEKRASAYNNLQQYDKSVADYRRVLDDYPTSPAAKNAIDGLQEALNNAGRPEQFADALAKYERANPRDQSLEKVKYEAAKNLYFGEKYANAVESLLGYLKSYPTGAFVGDARYLLGESYFRLNDRPNAVKYHQLVAADRTNPNAGKSVGRLADLELASKNYRNAITYYLQSLPNARNKKDQALAWNGLLEAYFQLPQYDSAIYYADEIVTKGASSVNAGNKATLYKGKALYLQGKIDPAIDEFLRTVNATKDEYGAEAQYLIGEAKYQQKQYDASLDALFAVNQKFGSYEKWRGKAFLLIADNYVAQKEIFQARATLNSIIEKSPDKATVEEAKAKLKSLEGM